MDEPPSADRVVLALALASLTSVAAFIALFGFAALDWSFALFVLAFGFPIAMLHATLLALPAYALLSRRWPLRFWNAVLGGFIVGALPSALLFLSAEGVATAGALGAAGGLAFWLVLRRTAGAPGL